MSEVTTEGGSTVRLTTDDMGNRLVICNHPAAPPGLRNVEVGRVTGGGFQMPFITPPVALSPGMLRAIADLIDQEEAKTDD